MGTEHVTHDQAITVLLACASLLERLEKVVPGNWSAARGWVDTQLNRIWHLRGAFPGLGSALTAFGLTHGTLIAHAIGQQLHPLLGRSSKRCFTSRHCSHLIWQRLSVRRWQNFGAACSQNGWRC